MKTRIVYRIVRVLLFICIFTAPVQADDLSRLFDRIENLKLERHGYVLGAELNPEQIKTAISNPIDAVSPDTFKFKDKNVFVVAQKITHRVLIIYEQLEESTQQKIHDLIGELYLAFDDPTVLAHDKVIYWAYGEKGKITSKEFDAARQDKKTPDVLAFVKCISDISIMEKKKEPSQGQVYYIISSDPVLEFFKD